MGIADLHLQRPRRGTPLLVTAEECGRTATSSVVIRGPRLEPRETNSERFGRRGTNCALRVRSPGLSGTNSGSVGSAQIPENTSATDATSLGPVAVAIRPVTASRIEQW